ncbi:MAG: class I SAM-dependent methyltransferase [Euzebyales bacterium]|nr:class I SAM-dependent methyltransferase [Euzebyales bacterium]
MDYNSLGFALANRWDPRHLETVHYTLAPRPGERFLEVGCGRGHLVKRLAADGVDVRGVDANPHAIAQGVSDRLRCMTADSLDFPAESFDLVASFHTIEHVPDVDAALAEMARVLRPGGRLLLVYPAEPIRGLYAVPASVIMHRHPFKARQIHCHTVRPRSLRGRLPPLGLREVGSRFRWLSTPQFATVARKTAEEP